MKSCKDTCSFFWDKILQSQSVIFNSFVFDEIKVLLMRSGCGVCRYSDLFLAEGKKSHI